MDLLFLDTYYVNGEESLINFYNIIKDFLVPIIAIGFPIWVTFYVTKKDREQNEKNRKDDFLKAKEEKLNAFKTSVSKEIERKNQVLDDIKYFNKSAVINLENHLQTLEDMLNKMNFHGLPTFSVTVFTNDYINSILSLNFDVIRPFMTQDDYVKYINAIKLVEGLYFSLDNILASYKETSFKLHRELDICTHKLFYLILKYEFDNNFDDQLFRDLSHFKFKYDEYYIKYRSIDLDGSYAMKLYELKYIFINENYMKVINKYPELNDVVLNFEIVLLNLERSVEYYHQAIDKIYDGLKNNYLLIKSFELKGRNLDLTK